MMKQFENCLIEKRYAETTPSGNPSTVYDYIKRVKRVCAEEQITPHELASCINDIVKKYDSGGDKEDMGNRSHRAVINALKRFQEFIIARK